MTTNEFLGERTRERDRFELELGDTFDVKASIVLLILTFLGTIAATMLTADRLTAAPKLAQIPVIALVVISGISCVACLWPKDYLFDDLPETYANWLADLGESDAERLEGVTTLSMELAKRKNHSQSRSKQGEGVVAQRGILVYGARAFCRARCPRLYSFRYPPFLNG